MIALRMIVQSTVMKFRKPIRRVAAASIILFWISVQVVMGQGFNVQNVLLDTMVTTLARQVGDNFMLSPKLAENMDTDGKPVQRPKITYQGDATANELLAKILQEHGLTMIKDPVTTVTRIAFTNEPVKTADASLLVGDTNAPIPMIRFKMVPLGVCLDNLAKSGKMTLAADPKLADGFSAPDGRPVSPPLVSIRWTNLTARRALLALCLNYDLSIVADEKSGGWRIAMKEGKGISQ